MAAGLFADVMECDGRWTISIVELPVPVWVSEIGMIAPAGPELDRILINDLSRQLASYLDQCALYGGGPAANQPTGLINVSGVPQNVAINSADSHGSFCAVEAQVEAANVDMTNYGVIVSPATRKILRSPDAGIT